MYDQEGNARGFGFIDFADLKSAEAAVAMNGSDFGGRELSIDFAKGKQERPAHESVRTERQPGCKSIFIGRLGFGATEDQIAEFFQNCGDIVNIRIGKDRETGEAKGYARVCVVYFIVMSITSSRILKIMWICFF